MKSIVTIAPHSTLPATLFQVDADGENFSPDRPAVWYSTWNLDHTTGLYESQSVMNTEPHEFHLKADGFYSLVDESEYTDEYLQDPDGEGEGEFFI